MDEVWLIVAERGDYEEKETFVESAWATESDAEAERQRKQAEADSCQERITEWLKRSVALHAEWRHSGMPTVASYNPPESYILERIGPCPHWPDDLAHTFTVVRIAVSHGSSKPQS